MTARTGGLLALCVAGALGSAASPLRAQTGGNDSGFAIHLQLGAANSLLHDVSPLDPGQSFESRRGATTSLRVAYRLAGPLSVFSELGTASRGSRILAPGIETSEYRTSWFDGVLGMNVRAPCVGLVCPSLDAGAVLAYNRDALLVSSTGRPQAQIGTQRYETSALVGVRVVVPRLRSLAFVVRRQEGLTDLPNDGTTGRSRSWALLLGIPLRR